MSRAAEVEADFADGERLFRLPIGRWRAVQERCDAGPMELLRRYTDGSWRVDDLREVIRQGLIGGGLAVAEADLLLRTNFDDLPLAQFVPLAQAVVMASVIGVADESSPGEPRTGVRRKTRSRTASSASDPSTAKGRRSASRPGKPTS